MSISEFPNRAVEKFFYKLMANDQDGLDLVQRGDFDGNAKHNGQNKTVLGYGHGEKWHGENRRGIWDEAAKKVPDRLKTAIRIDYQKNIPEGDRGNWAFQTGRDTNAAIIMPYESDATIQQVRDALRKSYEDKAIKHLDMAGNIIK